VSDGKDFIYMSGRLQRNGYHCECTDITTV